MFRPATTTSWRTWTRRRLTLVGPAFVAAVAYVDPGNVATNVGAGARYGYLLVWVVVMSNLIAMLVQYLSAKAGLATGRSLPALCSEHLGTGGRWAMWAQGEVVAMATDLAEIVGGALALQLLIGMPLLLGGIVTASLAYALLELRRRGHRPFEVAVLALLGSILVTLAYQLLLAPPDGGELAAGLVPRLAGADSVLIAVGLLGATVMPHAIYLHGALTAERVTQQPRSSRRRLLRSQRTDVVVALTIAGLMNLGMLALAAAVLHGGAGRSVDDLVTAHHELAATLGGAAALCFATLLLSSGLAASSVGALAGQVIMEGLLRRRVPLAVRRLVGLVPPLVVLALGVDPTRALVLSQVVLSFGIPFALVPLVVFTARTSLMGDLVNRRVTTLAAAAAAALVIVLNVVVVVTALG